MSSAAAERSRLAIDIMQAALSLAVLRFSRGADAVTDAEIEKAAELFGVGEDDADQIMLIYELLVAFGNSLQK